MKKFAILYSILFINIHFLFSQYVVRVEIDRYDWSWSICDGDGGGQDDVVLEVDAYNYASSTWGGSEWFCREAEGDQPIGYDCSCSEDPVLLNNVTQTQNSIYVAWRASDEDNAFWYCDHGSNSCAQSNYGYQSINFTSLPACQDNYVWTNYHGNTRIRLKIYWENVPIGNPAVFGNNQWNVYGYTHGGYNFNNQMNLSGVTYKGYYTDNNININSTARWATGSSPSDASGWLGSCMPIDNHTVVYKRQGFPCGFYEIDLNGNDDGVRCYVNGVQVYQIDACCADRGIIYKGILDANSTVEFRVSEGGGGSDLNVAFNNLGNLTANATYSPTGTCNLYNVTVSNPNLGFCQWINTNFGAGISNTQLNGVAAYTGGGCRLTPNSGSVYGSFTVDNPSSFNASDINVNYDFYIGNGSGADGMSISYGNIAMSSNTGESGDGSGLIIRKITYSGAGPKVQLVYNNSVLATYSGFPWRGATQACSLSILNGRLTYVIGGTTVFSNVDLGSAYLSANKSSWKWAFAARTGGATDDHYIYNLKITARDLEYSVGAGWQSSNVFTNLTGGNTYVVQARPKCSTACPSTIRTIALPNMNSELSATAISPKCVGGNDGSIDLSVSGSIHGARVVKITQLDNEPFNTNEIQAFQIGTGTNVALSSLGGVAAQSSTLSPSYPVTWLNDGNTNNGIGAHTNTSVGEWQKVSWEEPVSLDRIVLWNRTDCCQYRLDNIRIDIYGDLDETNLLLSQVVDADVWPTAAYTFSPVNYFSNATNTYAWSNSATTEDITGLSAGTYNVTVTNDYGCVNTLSGITVSAPASHTLSAVVTNEVCPADNNGAINLTVNSPRVSAEPAAFSGLSIWTKADAGIVKNKEGKVIQWQDLSGNDNHFKTTFGTNVEAVSSAIGGNPAVRFNANNVMQSTLDLNSNFTVIVVGKLNGGSNARLISSATNNWLLGWWGGYVNQFYSEGWVHNPGTSANTNAYIYTGTGNLGADSYALYSNGTNLATNNGGSQAPRRLSLGGWGANNGERSNGDVAEVIVYNRVLTNDERMAIEKYLANKYSITISHAGVNPTYSWSPGGATTEDIASLNAGSYTVSVNDVAGCTTQGTYTVGTDKTESTAPTSATASSTFSCSASAVDLTAVGGSLGTGATWEWYSDASLTTSVGSGSPLTVYPTANTTYYVRAEGDCNNTSAQSVAVFINGGSTAPGGSVSLASSTSASTCVVNDNNWHYYYNSSGELLAAINSNNQNLGNVTVEITVGDDGPFGQGFSPGVCGYTGVSDGEYVVPRYWDIVVDNQPSSAVDVIFYYNSADVTTLVNTINTLSADYVTCWGDVNSESDLMMTVNHTGGGTELFASLSPSAGPAAGQRQIAFSLSEFSGGKLHSNGGLTGAGNALPVELISFTAKAVNNQFIQLNWSTATEINNEGFAIERSEDGINFEKIAYIKGNGNSNITNQYSYQDSKVNEGIYYYRLKQNDYDGASEYSPIRNASITGRNQIVLSQFIPNPATEESKLNIILSKEAKIKVIIVDELGREVSEREETRAEGNQSIIFNTENLAAGIYTAKISVQGEEYTRKLVIKK